MSTSEKKVLAFDIGGTFVKLGVVDSNGRVLMQESINTNAHLGAEVLMKNLLARGAQLASDHVPDGIAFSTLGMIEPDSGKILGAAYAIPGYVGQSPKAIFESALSLPVSVENDGNCAAIAEGWIGAAKGMRNYIALTLGTGIGGGVVIDGCPVRGTHAAAAEWGYMKVNGEIWEDVASMRGLPILASRYMPQSPQDAKEIFHLHDGGNALASDAVNRWMQLLATGIMNLLYVFDPQSVIIGGGITARGEVFVDEIKEAINGLMHEEFRDHLDVRLAATGNTAGMLGAAKVWLEKYDPGHVGFGKSSN